MIRLNILALCLLFWSTSKAQMPDTAKLNAYFTALEQHNKFMGSVALSQNGKRVYQRTIGFADVEKQRKAGEHSKYRVGSVSKTFTAVLVLKTIEKKKLKLDQSIRKFFPGIPQADHITIRQLLTHRSGIPDFTDNDDYLSWNTRFKSEQEMVAVIAAGGSDFEPGTQSDYSNSNYVLLTYILEKTWKKPYAALLEEFITGPLKLKNTCLGGKIDTGKNECESYTYAGSWEKVPQTDPSIPLGAGGIVSTASDLVAFSDALFGNRLLKKESLEQMEEMQEDMGMGLFRMPFYERTSYGHRGGIDQFSAAFSYFPDGNWSFALVSNGMNYNGNDIPLTVLSAVFHKPFDVPELSVIELDAQELELYKGLYASADLPFKLEVTNEGGKLLVRATGQNAAEMQATSKHKFRMEKTGTVLEFLPEEQAVLLKQAEQEFRFVKEM